MPPLKHIFILYYAMAKMDKEHHPVTYPHTDCSYSLLFLYLFLQPCSEI